MRLWRQEARMEGRRCNSATTLHCHPLTPRDGKCPGPGRSARDGLHATKAAPPYPYSSAWRRVGTASLILRPDSRGLHRPKSATLLYRGYRQAFPAVPGSAVASFRQRPARWDWRRIGGAGKQWTLCRSDTPREGEGEGKGAKKAIPNCWEASTWWNEFLERMAIKSGGQRS